LRLDIRFCSVIDSVDQNRVPPASVNSGGRGHHLVGGDSITKSTTSPRFPTIRVNLLRAHGSAESHRQWLLSNPDKTAEHQRRYREKNRDVLSERAMARYWAKRDEISEQKRKRHQLHPEIAQERARAYRESHKAERAALQRLRKARKLSAPGVHTAADVTAQYERQHGKCYWCHEKVGDTYHVDHVTPLVKKGSNGKENIVIACPTCNLSKGAKHPMDFAGVLC